MCNNYGCSFTSYLMLQHRQSNRYVGLEKLVVYLPSMDINPKTGKNQIEDHESDPILDMRTDHVSYN